MLSDYVKKTTTFVYLAGAYDDEEAAARAYDLAALKYWGPGTLINFPVRDYDASFLIIFEILAFHP